MDKELKTGKLIFVITIIIVIGFVLFCAKTYIERAACGRVITSQDKEYSRKACLNEIARGLEIFKKKNGYYPKDLSAVDKNDGLYVISSRWSGPHEYSVSVDGQSYILRDIGLDKMSGTNDDIVWNGYKKKW